MTYPEAIQFLYSLQLFGAKLGLDTTRRLAALAGNPHEHLRFIHVAGTNGKGSTCAMLESIYRHARLRVGLFTSPHLVSFRERIQVNRELISESDVIAEVAAVQQWLDSFPADAHPTFFEVVTVMALRYFARQECDLVIWETGLGGRLDSTNIVTPIASVITNVQLDHEKWLGRSIQEIAIEKAGIIKSGVPVVTSAEEPALSVIRQTASERGAALHVVSRPEDKYPLPLAGEHQQRNAALAVATVRVLQSQIPVSEDALAVGLRDVSWPGRFQVIRRGAQTLVLDGAHNPAGAEALRDTIPERFPNGRRALIIGIMRDKNCAAICQALAPLAHEIVTCPTGSHRSADPAELAALCRAANPNAKVAVADSLGRALELTAAAPVVIVTGSLHFIGEALQILDPRSGPDERALNEWQPAASARIS